MMHKAEKRLDEYVVLSEQRGKKKASQKAQVDLPKVSFSSSFSEVHSSFRDIPGMDETTMRQLQKVKGLILDLFKRLNLRGAGCRHLPRFRFLLPLDRSLTHTIDALSSHQLFHYSWERSGHIPQFTFLHRPRIRCRASPSGIFLLIHYQELADFLRCHPAVPSSCNLSFCSEPQLYRVHPQRSTTSASISVDRLPTHPSSALSVYRRSSRAGYFIPEPVVIPLPKSIAPTTTRVEAEISSVTPLPHEQVIRLRQQAKARLRQERQHKARAVSKVIRVRNRSQSS